jgi:DNA ligase D-like protein (predicted 3'-phosphoesterase)/DNA ligase D-like protein (predicted polymerase)
MTAEKMTKKESNRTANSNTKPVKSTQRHSKKANVTDPLANDTFIQTVELDKYRQKRSFDQTPEPQGGLADTEKLIFVVQKHDASHLHYDFRIEVRGVLKSWAVPKGPSMNSSDHRLAMETEDHPYDYKDFEGIIPEGQYGGGTVLVWDTGTYEPAERVEGKAAQEKWLLANYYKNKLSIILHGKKLKGKFSLVKTFGKAENAWLLTKAKDDFESDEDITKRDQSVISGYTILEMAMDENAKIWQSDRNGSVEVSKSKPAKEEVEVVAEIEGPDALNEPREEEADSITGHKTVAELFPRAENKRSTRSKLSAESNWNKVFEEKIKSEGQITVEGEQLHLTNIEKKLWKLTNKAQLITYYNSIAEFILPHLKNRPLSLYLKNLNAGAPGLYIKDMEGFQPDFLDTFSTKRKHKAKGKADVIDYAVCNCLPALLWLVNLGCIDFNPWNSCVNNPLAPDFIAIDLDPSDEDFKKAVKTAIAAKQYFDEHQLTAYLKTSGKTGIHIIIPCEGFSFKEARSIAEKICFEIHKRVPRFTTLEVLKSKRGDHLFIDFSQNDEADTLACAYSVRPAKQPNVSTPLDWDELGLKLTPSKFTIGNTALRLEEKGDLWKDIGNSVLKASNSRILIKFLNGN